MALSDKKYQESPRRLKEDIYESSSVKEQSQASHEIVVDNGLKLFKSFSYSSFIASLKGEGRVNDEKRLIEDIKDKNFQFQ